MTRERIQILIASENEDRVSREEAFVINVGQGRGKRRKNVTGAEEKGRWGSERIQSSCATWPLREKGNNTHRLTLQHIGT